MKKIVYILLASGLLSLAACNGATEKKSGNGADSGAVGNSGAATGNGSAAGNSNATTDTSTTGNSATNPTVDSGKTPEK